VTVVPVALHRKARVNYRALDGGLLLNIHQELYDAVEDISRERIRELAGDHSRPIAVSSTQLNV
jgi:hypothetical protein